MRTLIASSILALSVGLAVAAPAERWHVVKSTTLTITGKKQTPQLSTYGDFATEAECGLAKKDAYDRAVKVMREHQGELCGELPACVVVDLLTDYPTIVLSLTSEGVMYGSTDVLSCQQKPTEERH